MTKRKIIRMGQQSYYIDNALELYHLRALSNEKDGYITCLATPQLITKKGQYKEMTINADKFEPLNLKHYVDE